VNEVGVRAFREGILTEASIMVPCPWFEESIALSKKHGIPVGIHFTATCEWEYYRWRPLTRGRSLVYEDGTQPRSVEEVRKTADRDELEAEYVAQVELVRARGVEPCFVDHHMAIVDPEVMMRVIRRVGIRSRQDFGVGNEDCSFPFAVNTSLTNEGRQPGVDKAKWLRKFLEGMGEGVHFLCCHVAERSSEMRSVSSEGSPWAEPYRATDLDTLTKPEVRELCKAKGIELISLAEHRG